MLSSDIAKSDNILLTGKKTRERLKKSSVVTESALVDITKEMDKKLEDKNILESVDNKIVTAVSEACKKKKVKKVKEKIKNETVDAEIKNVL